MDQKVESYISMNLHYSQTENETFFTGAKSYTSMNLHYSQTIAASTSSMMESYTSMNLHYSQTGCHARVTGT